MKKLIVIIALAFGAIAGTANYVLADEATPDLGIKAVPAGQVIEVDRVRIQTPSMDLKFAESGDVSINGTPILLAQADTGSGSATAPSSTAPSEGSAVTPADQLHDPIASPGAAWDDLKAAKKIGWASLVFVVLIMLAKLASRFGKPDSWLAKLGKGKVAVVVGALGALAAACYNAAADGGAWTAMLFAGAIALGHYLDASKA